MDPRDLTPGRDAIVSPKLMTVARVEERAGMIRVYGWTTVRPDEDVTVRPAPGTQESAELSLREMGVDPHEEEES